MSKDIKAAFDTTLEQSKRAIKLVGQSIETIEKSSDRTPETLLSMTKLLHGLVSFIMDQKST